MSWKSVELQVALPRSQDAGKQQDLMSKQGQRFQEALSQGQLQEDIERRRKVQEFAEIEKAKVDDDDSAKEETEESLSKQSANREKEFMQIQHPYLGSRVDFSR